MSLPRPDPRWVAPPPSARPRPRFRCRPSPPVTARIARITTATAASTVATAAAAPHGEIAALTEAPVASIATAARGRRAPKAPRCTAESPARAAAIAPIEDPEADEFDRDRGRRPDGGGRGPRPEGRPAPQAALTAKELAEVAAARVAPPIERVESAEVTPEAMAAAKEILENLMAQLDFHVRVEIKAGETNRLNVVGEGSEKESLGALIGRKGERLSALQHLVNLLLSKKVGEWTRILVDVEDYRGRRERQLRDLANRAAERVLETGKMLQLEPMPALERRWIHLALRDHEKVATQSIGEEPNRRVVVLPREL